MLATLIGLAVAAGCSGDAGLSRSGGGTPVSEPNFSLVLPGEWKEQVPGDSNLWQYLRTDEDLQLSVSVYNELADDATLEMYVESRIEAESQVSSATALTKPQYGDESSIRTARYDGWDSSSGRRISSVIHSDGSVLVQLYLEGYVPQQEMDQVLGEISQSLQLRP